MNDNDQEGYLTSNSLKYQEGSDSESESEQDSGEDTETIPDVDSGDEKSIPPFRPALKKSKSKQFMARSSAVDREDFEQAIFGAAIEEFLRTAVQDRKPGQSSKVPGRPGLRCTLSQTSTIVIRQHRRMTPFLSK